MNCKTVNYFFKSIQKIVINTNSINLMYVPV